MKEKIERYLFLEEEITKQYKERSLIYEELKSKCLELSNKYTKIVKKHKIDGYSVNIFDYSKFTLNELDFDISENECILWEGGDYSTRFTFNELADETLIERKIKIAVAAKKRLKRKQEIFFSDGHPVMLRWQRVYGRD